MVAFTLAGFSKHWSVLSFFTWTVPKQGHPIQPYASARRIFLICPASSILGSALFNLGAHVELFLIKKITNTAPVFMQSFFLLCRFFHIFRGKIAASRFIFLWLIILLSSNPIPETIAQNNHKVSKTTNFSYSDDRILKKLLEIPRIWDEFYKNIFMWLKLFVTQGYWINQCPLSIEERRTSHEIFKA
jgi:hypothetical protein